MTTAFRLQSLDHLSTTLFLAAPRWLAALLVFACCLQAGAASAQATAQPSYSVLSLIGDKLEIVSRELNTGTRINRNLRTPVALDNAVFDEAVARTAARVLHESLPGTVVSQLNTRSPVLFDRQRTLFEVKNEVLQMPEPIADAARAQGANRFLLVRKHRIEPRFAFSSGTIEGGGEALEGLGFYLDGTQMTQSFDKEHNRTVIGRGFIAPYVHAEVLLAEFPSGKVLGRRTVAANILAGSGREEGSINEPWLAMSAADKVKWLNRLIDKDIGSAIASLVDAR